MCTDRKTHPNGRGALLENTFMSEEHCYKIINGRGVLADKNTNGKGALLEKHFHVRCVLL
jgi:hypothetical protein